MGTPCQADGNIGLVWVFFYWWFPYFDKLSNQFSNHCELQSVIKKQ